MSVLTSPFEVLAGEGGQLDPVWSSVFGTQEVRGSQFSSELPVPFGKMGLMVSGTCLAAQSPA